MIRSTRRRATMCILALVPWLLASGCGSDDDSGGPGSDGGLQDRGPDAASLDEVQEILARVSSCLEGGDRIGIGLMVSLFDAFQNLEGRTESTDFKLTGALLECYMRGTTCEAIRACSQASESQASVCTAGDDDAHCNGNVLVECTDDPEENPEAYDCAAAGLICGEGDDDADCGESTCTPGTDQSRCEGDILWECDTGSGVFLADDCRYHIGYHCVLQGENDYQCTVAAGGTCGEDPDFEGDHVCIGDGPDCEPDTFENHCDGTTLVSCKAGREATYDCRNSGSTMTCGAGENGIECVQAQGQCSIETPETCNNGVITYCAAGTTTQLDCRSFGYSGCGVSMGFYGLAAYCTP